MTRSHDVGSFFFGCAVGAAVALILAPDARARTMKYLREKATGGVDYAKSHVEAAREVVEGAAVRTEQVIERVCEGLDSVKKVVASVEQLRRHS